jgi:hypothetical protein
MESNMRKLKWTRDGDQHVARVHVSDINDVQECRITEYMTNSGSEYLVRVGTKNGRSRPVGTAGTLTDAKAIAQEQFS